jgi:hypothetical protein
MKSGVKPLKAFGYDGRRRMLCMMRSDLDWRLSPMANVYINGQCMFLFKKETAKIYQIFECLARCYCFLFPNGELATKIKVQRLENVINREYHQQCIRNLILEENQSLYEMARRKQVKSDANG